MTTTKSTNNHDYLNATGNVYQSNRFQCSLYHCILYMIKSSRKNDCHAKTIWKMVHDPLRTALMMLNCTDTLLVAQNKHTTLTPQSRGVFLLAVLFWFCPRGSSCHCRNDSSSKNVRFPRRYGIWSLSSSLRITLNTNCDLRTEIWLLSAIIRCFRSS